MLGWIIEGVSVVVLLLKPQVNNYFMLGNDVSREGSAGRLVGWCLIDNVDPCLSHHHVMVLLIVIQVSKGSLVWV